MYLTERDIGYGFQRHIPKILQSIPGN